MSEQRTIAVERLRDWLEEGRPVTVLDIRPGDQRAEWAIPGSMHVDAYERLREGDPEALSGVEFTDEGPVVTVCAAGGISMAAAEQLHSRGIEAFSLEGGMKAWSGAWNTAEVQLADSKARVVQVRRTGKGCLSYMVASEGEAAVIDASVHPGIYVELARNHGWEIKSVLDTHVHADHLSRSRILAGLTGAALYLPQQERVSYSFNPLQDGDGIRVGQARLEAVHTPGHTPESTCYMLDGNALFTGDTLFLETVGRPDLEPGGAQPDKERVRRKARALHGSIGRLMELLPETLVLPGHTGEPVPFDGVPLTSTLGQLYDGIELLRANEKELVEIITSRTSPTPPNYQRNTELNEAGKLPEEGVLDLEAGANRCAAG